MIIQIDLAMTFSKYNHYALVHYHGILEYKPQNNIRYRLESKNKTQQMRIIYDTYD